MKKSRAFITLLIVLIVALGVGFIDVWGINGKGSAKDITLGLDLEGGVSITYQVVGEENPSDTDMADTIYKLEQRVAAASNSTEAIVYKEGSNRICVEIPGVTDANDILQELGRPGSLYFIQQTDDEGNTNYYRDQTGAYILNNTIENLKANGSITVEGTHVAQARAAKSGDDLNNNYEVELVMTEEGKQLFADVTTRAYSKGETLAIYYDDKIVVAPNVNGALTTGQASITGNYSLEEAEKLASTIRIGGLSLELEELHSKVVGAQLGQDAIKTSLKAGIFGFAVVAIFMICVYFVPGFAATLALFIYIVLEVMLINGFEITLTLSGIAGIILSIGMAVDANVIIFARIREEIASGISVQSAIKIGFNKALSAILDGNITTLIASIVLMGFGPSSVKGFATTLAIGIVLSMFTALVVTRLIIQALYAIGFKDAKFYGKGKEKKTVDFLSKRGFFFAISGLVIAAGIVIMIINGASKKGALNYSLEFKGGTATTVEFNEAWTLQSLNEQVVPEIEKATGSNVQVQTVSGTNEVIFKTDSLSVDKREALASMLEVNHGITEDKITTETISSTISNEMKRDTIIAVLVAIIAMLIYIAIRFKDIRFGLSSIIALAHDVLVVIAFYAAARVSVGNTFVACLLTIVGYSINATIVIFDRIRENKNASKDELKVIVNRSVTQTLSRSIFTSLTTFIMVAFLFGFGVSSIRDFALPLMVGIACGCYSSICIAGALWYSFKGGKKSDVKPVPAIAKNGKNGKNSKAKASK